MSRSPARPRLLAACAGALLILAGFAIGCGSGGDESSQPAGTAGSAAGGGSEVAGAQPDDKPPIREAGAEKPPSGKSGEGAGKSSDQAEPRGEAESSDKAQSGGKGKDRPQRTSQGGGSATARADANTCVERFGRATCAAMTKPAENPAQSVQEPADCTQVMTTSECEELAAAQESARRNDESVNVEECIENPTPHCEEVLRPVLEAQGVTPRGASQ